MQYRFETFEVLEQQRQLRLDGQPVPIGARAFDVLLALIQGHERVLSKAELLDRVWPGQAVEENNLQVQISGLRKLLGAQAIATIPGRGYRLALRPLDASGPAIAAAATPASPRPPRSNLPAQLPALYGREADCAALRALLQQQRVVSIVAAGGVGKTRLARAVAAGLADGFADGVWCIELAALSQPELLAPELARTLGVQLLGAQASALPMLLDLLRPQHALLLFDNCEHLLPAVASLVEAILSAAPRVHVLLTSQEPLKIAGEQLYRLGTLAQPEGPGLAAAQASGAVQLLTHRIQALQPEFALTEDKAGRLAAICRRLDGIALALELAAARVPVLGLAGLLARLDERFELLGGGSRPTLARHQTLRAMMDFSHGLLSAEEQAVFRRLGVFAGSFSAEAAQALAADAGLDRWAVLAHLSALVDKSLLIAEPGEPPRLRLLETSRAYALERLEAAGEAAAMRERHARVIGRLIARAAEHDCWRLSDAQLLERYGPEQPNLRAALDWALVHDAQLAIETIGHACPLWREALSLQPEGARYCEAALALVDENTPALAAGRLWCGQGWMLIWSQQQRGRAAALRAAELLRQTGDHATLGICLLLLIPGTTPPDAQQTAVLDELRRLYDPQAPARVRAQYLSASARYAMGARRYAEATRLYAEARTVLAGCGATQWEAVLAWTMAGIALSTGDLAFAETTLRETAERLQAQPTRGVFLAFCLGSLATALLFSDVAAAREALARAAPLIVRYQLGSRYAATAAWLALQEGRPEDAAQLMAYGRAAALAAGVDAEEPGEVAVRQRVQAALAEQLDAAALAALLQTGATLDTQAAYGRALAVTGELQAVG